MVIIVNYVNIRLEIVNFIGSYEIFEVFFVGFLLFIFFVIDFDFFDIIMKRIFWDFVLGVDKFFLSFLSMILLVVFFIL